MKVKVSLFGTLRQGFPDYRPSQGIELEIPEGATVEDLLALLKIPESQGAVVISEGRVLKTADRLQRRAAVNIVQAMGGG
jgi:molybdopterin synthase sulfur carrier subunit